MLLDKFCNIFENGEIVKNCTALERELNFEGLAGFGFVCFVLFSEGWFLDGFGIRFLMNLGLFLGAFLAPKIDKKRDRFRD